MEFKVGVGLAAGLAAAALLLGGCTAAEAGVVAVTRLGSRMSVAIVPCENQHISILTLVDADVETESQRKLTPLGRLERTEPLDRLVEMDPASPGPDWTGRWVSNISELEAGASYEIGAGGGNWTTTDTTFTREDLERSPDGSWLYADPETRELLTAPSLDDVETHACGTDKRD